MRWTAAAVLGLAGCATLGFARPLEVRGWADDESFRCARTAVANLGYVLSSADSEREFVLGTRTFDDDRETTTGYLSVRREELNGRSLLYAKAERFDDDYRRVNRIRIPSIAPQPGPHPTPYPQDTLYRPSIRSGARRVAPGQVGTDARKVIRQCTHGEA